MHWLWYILTGSCAGLFAGLFGVGGGIIIVPMLTFVFTSQLLPPLHIAHLALGTSLATIMFTSVSSFRAHHGRGAVNWNVVKAISPGIVAGTFAGSWVAANLSTQFLKGFFVVFLYYVALQMLLGIRPAPHRELPGKMGIFSAGSVIGGISSLVGIGGGSLSVPFLSWCNVPLISAIGTSAAIGLPIAVAGAAGYITSGIAADDLPKWSLGFVYLPALLGVSIASICTAPLGARLAHTLPVGKLKKLFALLLIVMGTKLLASLINHPG